MPNAALSALTELTAPVSTDELYVVVPVGSDFSGSPPVPLTYAPRQESIGDLIDNFEKRVFKTSDETINAPSAYTNIAELELTVFNCRFYEFMAIIIFSGTASEYVELKLSPQVTGGTASSKTIAERLSNISYNAAGTPSNDLVPKSSTENAGTPTGEYSDTFVEDGNYYVMTHAAGAIDLVFDFVIDVNQAYNDDSLGKISVYIIGYYSINGESLNVNAWNWGGATYESIGTYAGQNGTSNTKREYQINFDQIGTGGDLGKVRIQIENTSLTGALNIDKISIIDMNLVRVTIPSGDGAVQIYGTYCAADGTAQSLKLQARNQTNGVDIKKGSMMMLRSVVDDPADA